MFKQKKKMKLEVFHNRKGKFYSTAEFAEFSLLHFMRPQ